MNLPNRETDPSGLWGSTVALVGAVLALLVAFGVPLTDTQTVAVLGLATAAGPLVTQWLIRRDAWSPVAHFQELRQVEDHVLEDLTGQDGHVDVGTVLAVAVIVLVVVVLARLL